MTERRGGSNDLERRIDTLQAELNETRELLNRRAARYARTLQALTNLETRQLRQEIHDGASQTLTGVAYLAHCLTAALTRRGLPDAADADKIEKISGAAIDRARGLTKCLSLAGAGPEGLERSLQELATFTTEVLDVPCSFDCQAVLSHRLGHTSVHLFRIALDAVRMLVKSEFCTGIDIAIVVEGSEVVMNVRGKGADAQMVATSEIKKNNLWARADLIGATLSVRQDDPGAAVVRCVLPRLDDDALFRSAPLS